MLRGCYKNQDMAMGSHRLLISVSGYSGRGKDAGRREGCPDTPAFFLFLCFTVTESGQVTAHIEAVTVHTEDVTSHMEA